MQRAIRPELLLLDLLQATPPPPSAKQMIVTSTVLRPDDEKSPTARGTAAVYREFGVRLTLFPVWITTSNVFTVTELSTVVVVRSMVAEAVHAKSASPARLNDTCLPIHIHAGDIDETCAMCVCVCASSQMAHGNTRKVVQPMSQQTFMRSSIVQQIAACSSPDRLAANALLLTSSFSKSLHKVSKVMIFVG
jgi:hypothetical protein